MVQPECVWRHRVRTLPVFPRSNRRRFECVVPNLNLIRSAVTGGSPVTDLSQRTAARCFAAQPLFYCNGKVLTVVSRSTAGVYSTVSIIPASVGLFTKMIVVSNNPVNAVAAGHISALHACTWVPVGFPSLATRLSFSCLLCVSCAHSRFGLAGRRYTCTIGY